MSFKILLTVIIAFWLTGFNFQTHLTPKEIVSKAEEKMRGVSTSKAEIVMRIERPNWNREIGLKSWTKDDKYSMLLIISPARDKGTAYLKRDKEIWNWQPSIDRTIKLPPSMMTQSWMGSDFTNDDLILESSNVKDYEHRLLGEERIGGLPSYKIEMTPKQDAAVVWGKVITWIDKADFMYMKSEFYDEYNDLVNTMIASNPKVFQNIKVPTKMEMIPVSKAGHKTTLEYKSLIFDEPIQDDFFTVQNMKRLR